VLLLSRCNAVYVLKHAGLILSFLLASAQMNPHHNFERVGEMVHRNDNTLDYSSLFAWLTQQRIHYGDGVDVEQNQPFGIGDFG
jgi:hypothetical protein